MLCPRRRRRRIIGRKKLSDIELDDAVKPSNAHSALTVIEENGKEVKILRDNMPFGQPSASAATARLPRGRSIDGIVQRRRRPPPPAAPAGRAAGQTAVGAARCRTPGGSAPASRVHVAVALVPPPARAGW